MHLLLQSPWDRDRERKKLHLHSTLIGKINLSPVVGYFISRHSIFDFVPSSIFSPISLISITLFVLKYALSLQIPSYLVKFDISYDLILSYLQYIYLVISSAKEMPDIVREYFFMIDLCTTYILSMVLLSFML